MIRKIISIDESKCDGCGLCVNACHEGAIGMVGGKAKLLRDDYCDGLGDCLPACPTGAITFIEREAAAYDDAAVKAAQAKKAAGAKAGTPMRGCPGSNVRTLIRDEAEAPKGEAAQAACDNHGLVKTELRQWPVQIKLVPEEAPYFDGAHLLIAADCAAYADGNFHSSFMKDKITIIGCPKLDEGDYSEKLTRILAANDIKSVTVARMEVPCCGGLAMAAMSAVDNCGKNIPISVVKLGIGR